MRKLILLMGLLGMAGLLAGAFLLDCTTLTRRSRLLVETTDGELIKLEDRLLQALDRWPNAPEEVRAAMVDYKNAANRDQRHKEYDSLAAAADRGLIASGDFVTWPPKEVADSIAGLMNRRNVAMQPFQEVDAADRAWRETVRGKWGAWGLGRE